MAKDNYQSKVYNFLVRTNRIDPQETGYESFVNQMSNQNYLNQIYNVLKEEQKSGRLGTLKGYNEFSTEFSTPTTPTTTTETEVVSEEETPQQGTPARRMSPIPQALVQKVQPQTNQPQPTPEETQIAPIDQQAGQVQGGMPISGDVLANAPRQEFQWSGQAPTKPVVQPQTGMPQTPEQGMQQGGINPADLAVSTIGSFETSLIGGIGSELKGISELGYSLDKKIVGALEGTPLEGGYSMLSKPEDSWIYQAGQGLQNFAEENLYRNPQYQGGVLDIVAQGGGSVASIMASSGFNPAGGVVKLGTKAMTNPQLIAYGAKQLFSRPSISGALMMVGQETDGARKLHRYANSVPKDEYVFNRVSLGESKEDASKAYDKLKSVSEDEVASGMIPFALFSGATEAIPMERLFSRLGKASKDLLISAFKNGGIQGAEEYAQEAIQQAISNIGKGEVYNEAQRLTEGIVESGEAGGATGFVLGSLLTALAGKRANIAKAVADGTMTKEEAIAELGDINKAQTLVNDKLQALDNKLLLTEGGSRIAGLLPERTETKPADKKAIPMGGAPLPSSGKTIVTPSPYEVANLPEAQDFFEKNSPSETNVINSMPASVENTLDKIAEGDIAVSAESLHEAYKWINDSFKQVVSNQTLSNAEKGATLNLLSNMLSDIDKGNTYLQETEAMLSEGMDAGKFLPEQKGKPLPQGQAPKGTATPSISQAKAIREENKRKQAGTTTLPSSGQTIITPAPATTEVATEAVAETPTGTTAEAEVTTIPQAGVVGGEVENRKNKQLEIINKENPAPNNYNTWVRSVEDIKTADEVFEVAKNEGAIYPDFTEQDMEDALSKGEVVVYSSYPIKNGVFVSPSKMNAQDYAGGKGGKIYSKVVKLEDVAWIDEGQGQYAKVEQSLQTTPQTPVAVTEANPALADVESTAKALESLNTAFLEAPLLSQIASGKIEGKNAKQIISEAYHSAKAKPESERTAQETELITQVEKLLTPTQDAVQKQTAGQVPVQSGTTSSQEVAKGEPQAEPQSTADKGQAKATATQEEVGTTPTAETIVKPVRKLTDTPSLKDVEIVSVENANLSASESTNVAESISQNNENNSWNKVLKNGVKNLGNGWFLVGKTTGGESILHSPTTNETYVLKSEKGGIDAIAVNDFLKNNNLTQQASTTAEGEVGSDSKKEGNDKKIAELEKEKLKLTSRALKEFPNSPKQLKTRARIDEINAELQTLKSTPEKVTGKTTTSTEVKPVKKTYEVFRGQDEDYEVGVYDGTYGKGKYYTGDRKSAKVYGKNVTSHKVELSNPFIIKGTRVPGVSLEGMKDYINENVIPKGYDGVILLDGKGNIFELVKFETPATTTTTTEVTLNTPNETTIKDIEKIENATEKGRELALSKPVNKWVKRAFDSFQDISSRAKKAGIYDGTTLKIGGKEYTVDTPAKFKAFLAQSQANFDAINEAVKGVESFESVTKNIMGKFSDIENKAKQEETKTDKASDDDVVLQSGFKPKQILAGFRAGMKALGFGDKFVGKVATAAEDWTAKAARAAMRSKNSFVAKAANNVQGFIRNIARTDEEITKRRRALGTVKSSPLVAMDFYNNAVGIVGNDPRKLQRVHQVLDPEAYEGEVSAGNIPRVTEADLNPDEKQLYDILRFTLDYIHDWHYQNGFIKQETYDKYKGTYSPRFWEDTNMVEESPELAVMFQQMGKALDRSYIKQRKDIDDIQSDIVEDPVYGAAIRMAQTLRNQSLLDYASQVSTTKAVWNGTGNPPPGYVLLEGPKYGALNGKYVARDVAEDFKGYYMADGLMNEAYRLFRLYDNTGVRQFVKQSKTVFNPITLIGNAMSNFSFAFAAGVDPANMAANVPAAAKSVKDKDADYKYLVQEGVLGTDVFSGDIKTKSESVRRPTSPTQKSLKEKLFDTMDMVRDFYGATDDVAKVAVFRSLLEQGKTREQAAKIVYESTQNYNEVGRAYDFASKMPFVGNPYIKFKADLTRIVKNGITRRPLTTAAYITGLYAIAMATSKLSDEEEEVRKAREARSFIPKIPMPDFMKKLGIGDVPLVWQTKYGELNAARLFSPMYVYDTGEEGFMGNLAEITSYLPVQAKATEEEQKDFPFQVQFSDPLLGPLAQLAFYGTDFRGKQILDPTRTKFKEGIASPTDKLLNASNYLANAWVPFYDKGYGVVQAFKGEEDYYGRVRNWQQALAGTLIKVQDMSKPEVIKTITKDIEYKVSRIENIEKEQRNLFNQNGLGSTPKKEIEKIQSNDKFSADVKKKKTDEILESSFAKYADLEERKAKIVSSALEQVATRQKITAPTRR